MRSDNAPSRAVDIQLVMAFWQRNSAWSSTPPVLQRTTTAKSWPLNGLSEAAIIVPRLLYSTESTGIHISLYFKVVYEWDSQCHEVKSIRPGRRLLYQTAGRRDAFYGECRQNDCLFVRCRDIFPVRQARVYSSTLMLSEDRRKDRLFGNQTPRQDSANNFAIHASLLYVFTMSALCFGEIFCGFRARISRKSASSRRAPGVSKVSRP